MTYIHLIVKKRKMKKEEIQNHKMISKQRAKETIRTIPSLHSQSHSYSPVLELDSLTLPGRLNDTHTL
jgi:hypothetical protein